MNSNPAVLMITLVFLIDCDSLCHELFKLSLNFFSTNSEIEHRVGEEVFSEPCTH